MGILKNVILTDRVVEGEDKTVRERWEERERERETQLVSSHTLMG